MTIDRAALEARIAELQAQLKQAEANAHAIAGAIQNCQHFLETLEKE